MRRYDFDSIDPEGEAMREPPPIVQGRYRKRPVVVDAILWDGTERCMKAVLEFADLSLLPDISDGYIGTGLGYCPPSGTLDIPTLEGTMRANPGDWIIRGVKGELYPCKPDIFVETYIFDAAPGGEADEVHADAEQRSVAAGVHVTPPLNRRVCRMCGRAGQRGFIEDDRGHDVMYVCANPRACDRRQSERRCPTCHGICTWHDESWVCRRCGDEFYELDVAGA